MPLFPFVAPMLLAATPANYQVGLVAEARASVDGASDYQFDPILSAGVPVGSGSLSASYSPRILVLQPRSRGPASLLHRVRLAGEWRMGRDGRGFLGEDATYGREVFSLLAAAAEGTQLLQSVDRLLTQAQLPPLTIFSESTVLGFEQPIARRLRMLVSATYAVTGGADAEARALFPVSHGPSARLGLIWSVHSRNTLTASLDAAMAYSSTGRRSYIFDANAGWTHQFSTNTRLALSLGAGGGREVGQGVSGTVVVLPYVDALLQREPMAAGRGSRWGANLRVRVQPAIDPLTGLVYARGDGIAGVDYYPSTKLKLVAIGGGALALSGPLRGQAIGLAGLSASYELNRHIAISGGGRLVHQRISEWVGFVALKLSYGEHI